MSNSYPQEISKIIVDKLMEEVKRQLGITDAKNREKEEKMKKIVEII